MREQALREILAEVDVQVVHLNRRNWLVAKCPFAEYLHEYGTDTNPSFFIKVAPDGYSGYNCYTCKQTGNLTRFFDKLGSLRGHDYNALAIRALLEETPDNFEDWDQVRDEEARMTPLDKDIYFRMYPSALSSKNSVNYLRRRDISKETVELLEIRHDPDEARILFPVYGSQERLYGFTGRTTLPKEKWPRTKFAKVKDYSGLKKDRLLLGEHLIQDDKPILLVEGLFAYANMYEIGADEFCSPVASMGSHLSIHQASILTDYGLPVYLLYDNDLAGLSGLYGPKNKKGEYEGGGAVDLLRPHVPTMVCQYPEGIDDPDELDFQTVKMMVRGDKNFMA